MEQTSPITPLTDLFQKKSGAPVIIAIKDCISVLLLNSYHADKVPKEQHGLFDLVHHFDAGEFWVGGALARLDALELPQLDRSIDDLIKAFKAAGPNFDITRLRLAVLEEPFVRAAAKIRQRYGIPGPKLEDVDRFTDKALMKQLAGEGGLDMAKYVIVTPRVIHEGKVKISSLESHIGYPMMFKPVHGVGSAGIAKIESHSQLQSWLADHPEPDMEYLAEEYMTGPEYHSLALVQSSGVQPFPAPFFVYGHSFFHSIRKCVPLCTDIERDPQRCSIVAKFLLETIRIFNPPEGSLVFVQGFMTEDGKMKFSELAYRAPGLIGSLMFVENAGISPESVQIMAQVRPLDLKQLATQAQKRKNFFANIVYPKTEGVIKSLQLVPTGNLGSEVEVAYKVSAGETLTAASSIADMAARVFLWNDDGGQLRKDIDWLKDNFQPVIMDEQ